MGPKLMQLVLHIHCGPCGRGTLFVDIKLKVPPQYTLLMLKRNSYFNVNKRMSTTRWTTMYLFKCEKANLKIITLKLLLIN